MSSPSSVFRVASKSALLAAVILLAPQWAYGDGLDLGYFVRAPMELHSPGYVAAFIVAAMVVNYALNFIVIGLPSVAWGGVLLRRAALGLIALTLLGQLADRLGAVLGLATAMLFNRLEVIFLSNLVYSGVAIFLLAYYFLRRWSVSFPLRWQIALALASLPILVGWSWSCQSDMRCETTSNQARQPTPARLVFFLHLISSLTSKRCSLSAGVADLGSR
jgi:hypothetical protein